MLTSDRVASTLRRVATAAVLLVVAARPGVAFASLGGREETIDVDRIQAQGALTAIVRTTAYTRHELRTASGTIVREYVSPAGVVFAVTWDGPWLPDLRQTLGSYFDSYQQALRTRARRARGVVQIDAPNLTVRASGHARSFTGRVLVPSLTPTGVRIEALP